MVWRHVKEDYTKGIYNSPRVVVALTPPPVSPFEKPQFLEGSQAIKNFNSKKIEIKHIRLRRGFL